MVVVEVKEGKLMKDGIGGGMDENFWRRGRGHI